MIYLDYAASCPLYPQAAEELKRCALEDFANPGGLHRAAGRCRALLQRSRRQLASLLDVPDRSVFFCSGGTEANNWAIRCGAGSAPGHLLIGECEHKSVLESARAMEAEGFSVTLLRPDRQGQFAPEAVEAAIRPDTRLLSLQAANNETGALQDVSALAAVARRHGVIFHCDAVQSFGHMSLPLAEADLVSLSGHKLGGPRGVGCLIIRQGLSLPPLIRGGGQELGLRAGTEDVAAISAFALAAALACEAQEREAERVGELRRLLTARLQDGIPGAVFHESPRMLPGILNFSLPGLSGEELLMRLDLRDICISTGAACAASDPKPSHVLLAMGISPEEARRSVRLSLGRLSTAEETETAAAAIIEIHRRFAKASVDCEKRR